MKFPSLVIFVLTLTPALWGAGFPDWSNTPTDAEVSARSLDKPVVLLWQSGPGAVDFTLGIDRLFSTWPGWSRQASQTAIFARARAWEGPLPSTYPPMPDGGVSSALVLWDPHSGRRPTVWTEVPPVLDLSRKLAEVSRRSLDDPYTLGITAYLWEKNTLVRDDQGPWWYGSGPDGDSAWVEEGPLGSVLVLKEFGTGRKAAFPLDSEWSYLFNPAAQTWTPWNPVLVKHR